MLIPDGGLREKCIFFVRLSSEFCIVFLQFSLFVVIIVFPLHKKCAVKREREGGGVCFYCAAGEDEARQRLLERIS